MRSPLVTVGDRGRTPFTRPGVIAWDGGSVMGSFGIDVHKMFAQKTQALLGRPAALYVSATPGADVADMIAEAPAEVDTHFDPVSDANVCVVQGGASDLKDGPEVVGAVFDALKAYCAGRRAAGFQVAVLTLLPRSDIPYFNEARNSFNALVREQWPDFADALVDVAADPGSATTATTRTGSTTGATRCTPTPPAAPYSPRTRRRSSTPSHGRPTRSPGGSATSRVRGQTGLPTRMTPAGRSARVRAAGPSSASTGRRPARQTPSPTPWAWTPCSRR